MKMIFSRIFIYALVISIFGCNNKASKASIADLVGDNELPFNLEYYQSERTADSIMLSNIESGIISRPYTGASYYEYRLKFEDDNFPLNVELFFYHDSLYKIDIRQSTFNDRITEVPLKQQYDLAATFFEDNSIDFGGRKEFYDKTHKQYTWNTGADERVFWPDENHFIIIFNEKKLSALALKEYSNKYIQEARERAESGVKVENSTWDGSVSQLKKYLKNNLSDPDSYESIEWSEVKNVDGKYIIRHKYRAKNALGGYVIKNQVFELNLNGDVISVSDI